MEIPGLPVAYYDDNNIWSQFSTHIISRLPLKNVPYKPIEGKPELLSSVQLSFVPHNEAYWKTLDEDIYRQPYLGLFVLNCTDFENYKAVLKDKLKQWITIMEEREIEWLILYIPSLAISTESQHKSYRKTYDKLQNDISALIGSRQERIIRMYSHNKRKFASIDHPSIHSDEYWMDMIRLFTEVIGISLQSRVNQYIKQITLLDQPDREYFKYCLAREGLAFVYEAVGKKAEALMCYDEIIKQPEAMDPITFVLITYDKFAVENKIMNPSEFRQALAESHISELSFKEYIFSRQLALFEGLNMPLLLGQKALTFLVSCMKIFNTQGKTSMSKFWGYIKGRHLAEILTRELISNFYTDVADESEKEQVYYIIAILVSFARSRLERLLTEQSSTDTIIVTSTSAK